jgi:hypothetical protein
MSKYDRIKNISNRMQELTEYQIGNIGRIIDQLQKPKHFWRNENSDLVTNNVLQDFGDTLRIHHVFSAEALSKDRFEYALERVLQECGFNAKCAPKGNPGHDITIDGMRVSLKTQADKGIKLGTIHISKFMELGKGEWNDKIEHLHGLLERFYCHMMRYDRIFTLRRLKDEKNENYELVEIPKEVLECAEFGVLSIVSNSKQTPKPGYCTVSDHNGLAFQLYFDGGTERKLQVKSLRKDLCIVHANWRFPRQQADKEPVLEYSPFL